MNFRSKREAWEAVEQAVPAIEERRFDEAFGHLDELTVQQLNHVANTVSLLNNLCTYSIVEKTNKRRL